MGKVGGSMRISFAGTGGTKRAAGFTLVEVMIVVSIVGVLAAIGTLSLRQARLKGRTGTAQAELEMIAAAVLELAWDTGRYPNKKLRNASSSKEEWALGGAAVGLVATDGGFPNWDGPYLDNVTEDDDGDPVDPWGNKYFFDPDYSVDGQMRIVVGSFGPNGVGRNQYDEDDVYVIIK